MSILTQSARLVRRSCAHLLTAGLPAVRLRASGASLLCPACRHDLPRLRRHAARAAPCRRRLARSAAAAWRKPPHYDATDAPSLTPSRSTSWCSRSSTGIAGARQLFRPPTGLSSRTHADLIIPLPLHSLRLRESEASIRRSNWHARSPGPGDSDRRAKLPAHRHTATQADLPWRERAGNVRGAFDCSSDLTGRRLLLIDDVMTTGASLNELARTVKLHGAAQVALLVSRAPCRGDAEGSVHQRCTRHTLGQRCSNSAMSAWAPPADAANEKMPLPRRTS
jgi:predicted amidophosphoribosyltransferase